MRHKVLIVDDQPGMAEALATALEDEYDTIIARDGAEGVEAAMRERPDLILLDIQLSVLDGFETLAEIRKRNVETRMVMISGYFTDIDRRSNALEMWRATS